MTKYSGMTPKVEDIAHAIKDVASTPPRQGKSNRAWGRGYKRRTLSYRSLYYILHTVCMYFQRRATLAIKKWLSRVVLNLLGGSTVGKKNTRDRGVKCSHLPCVSSILRRS